MTFDPRTIAGIGERRAPPWELSGSSGDRDRFSWRPSKYNRLWLRGVANDDATRITEGTDALLVEIRDLLRALLAK